MPIGEHNHMVASNRVTRFLTKFLGTLDLHSHIRLSPILDYFKIKFKNQPKDFKIFELGCGNGNFAFMLDKIATKIGTKIIYTGTDSNAGEIGKANELLSHKKFKSSFVFHNEDATAFLKNKDIANIDTILLLDFIEHIKDVESLLFLTRAMLNNGGIYVISVPTPRYSSYFGQTFHKRIGHVKNGYTVNELDEIFINKLGCARVFAKYNTGIFSNVGCWLYYNIFRTSNKYLRFLKGLVLYIFRFTDFYNSPQVSCTLFTVYEKK